MSKTVSINIEDRDGSLNPRQIRAKGLLPATVYGSGFESKSIQLDSKEFVSLYKDNKTAIFELQNGKDTLKTLVKNAQMNATTRNVLNVEFQKVNENEKVRVTLPIATVGSSEAVKAGAQLRLPVSTIEVECLPQDIPTEIQVDISSIVGFDDRIAVSEVKYPQGVTAVSAPNVILAKVTAPRAAK